MLVLCLFFLNATICYCQNVGIGIAAPQWKLDVRGGSPDDGQLISIGNSDQSHRMLFFGGRQNDPNPFIQVKGGDPLRFGSDLNGFSEWVRIEANGNVGIGTVADSSAILDLRSQTRGLLIPRYNSLALNNILYPAKGLLVLDTLKNLLMQNAGTPAYPEWRNITPESWKITGNSNTDTSVNFIGTTNNVPLRFKVNNQKAGFIGINNGSTYFGYKSGLQDAPGYGNTAIGNEAFMNNTAGTYSTALGSSALYYDTSFGYNTAIGSLAMLQNRSGYFNTAVGAQAFYYSKFGARNTAIGASALYSDSTGDDNTAIGSATLRSNLSGSYNIAVGGYAMYFHLKGNSNTAMGYYALNSDTGGQNNAAIGAFALYTSKNSNQNTAIGKESLYSTTSGPGNTGVGYQSLYLNIDGSNNTAIGANAGVNSGGLSNATAIGYMAQATASNYIQLGNSNVAQVNTYGNLTVLNGKGIIRSVDGIQQKKLTTTVTVNVTISAGATVNFPFSFPEVFSGLPDVYVGNITGGAGGFAEVIMSVANISTGGGSLFVNNPRAGAFAPNFTVKIIAIGPQ